VAAVAVEVADTGARQGPFEDPGHRGRVQGGFLHVFAEVDLAKDRPALNAGPGAATGRACGFRSMWAVIPLACGHLKRCDVGSGSVVMWAAFFDLA
jgi:hypothetical protein